MSPERRVLGSWSSVGARHVVHTLLSGRECVRNTGVHCRLGFVAVDDSSGWALASASCSLRKSRSPALPMAAPCAPENDAQDVSSAVALDADMQEGLVVLSTFPF